MRSFTPISHTSEAGIALRASTLEELFLAGLDGISRHLVPDLDQGWPGGVQVEVRIESPDLTAALIDFLSEALTLGYIRRAVFFAAAPLVIHPGPPVTVTATLIGEPVQGFEDDIKAITYHGAEVRRTENGHYETTVIFDI